METAAVIIIIVQGILLIAILIAVAVLLVTLIRMVAFLNEKIDPVIDIISNFAKEMENKTGKQKSGTGNIFKNMGVIYKYISVIPSVLKEQFEKNNADDDDMDYDEDNFDIED